MFQRAAQQWPPPPLSSIRPMGPSAEEERRRFESEQNRRAQEEAAARHYLNMAAAAARSNSAALIHRPPQPHQQPSSHNNNKQLQQQQQQQQQQHQHHHYQQQQHQSAATYSSSAASIHYQVGIRGQQKDPGPPPSLVRTNGAPQSAHHGLPPSTSSKPHPGHQDPKYPVGFKPYEMYPSRSSSTSPGPHHVRQPQQQQQMTTTSDRLTHSPRYGSSIPPSQRPPHGVSGVQNQIYGKPAQHLSAHPHVTPPPAMHTSGMAHTPPPAHGGSAPRHIGPPSDRQVRSAEEIPAPIPLTSQQVDQPLDLGLPAKRRADDTEVVGLSPKKMLKIEPNAQLFKVSEPSVLQASEPSIITTVVNSALTSVASSSNDRADTQSETSSTVRDEADDSNEGGIGYVHKLKKAWIKAYSSDPTAKPATPPPPPLQQPPQQQTSSGVQRATPSPALSNKSTGSATSSSRGTGRGSSTTSRVAGSKPVNGHSTLPVKKKVSHLTSSSESEEEDDDDSQNYRSSGSVRSAKAPGGRGRGRYLRQRASHSGKGRAVMSATASSGESLLGGDSDKDSDISTATSRKSQRDANSANTTARKRGRKPGRGKISPAQNSIKKLKEDASSLSSSSSSVSSETSKLFGGKKKPSVAQLKKTGQSFLQDASCFEVAPKLAKCRECRWTQSQRNKKMPNIFCRFYAFRRVRYAKNGQLCVAGFCDPKRDVLDDDLSLWLKSESGQDSLDSEQSLFILENLRFDFDHLLKQERLAVEAHEGEGNNK